MPPTLLAPDRQDTWTPVWYLEGSAWPEVFSTRDVDIPGPAVLGAPFVVGGSEVGGEDLVGGGAGATTRQAYFRILNTPTITRRMVSVAAFGTSTEVSDVTVELDNTDGALSGDYHGAAFTLTAYDPLSGFLLERGAFIVASNTRNRGTFVIQGTSLDPGIPEDQIPKGVIDTETFPLAVDVGKTPTWLFGNAVNLSLLYVRDDQTESQFDYLVCRGTAAAITAIRRVTPNGATPFVTLGTAPNYTDGYIELEPFPGMARVLRNGNMEGWAAGAAAAPDNWVVQGAGAIPAKNQTAGQFDEGAASASLTRVGADALIGQNLTLNAPELPIEWWRGRTVTLNMRVQAFAASRVLISISDGIGLTDSLVFHSGSGFFELMTVTRTIDAAATSVSILGRIVTGDTTANFDDARVYLKAESWEEVIRTDLYPGYTAVRFFFRQDDDSDALHQMVADVHGWQAERNRVRAVRTLLSSVAHGLGRPVDAPSFDQAEIDVLQDYDSAVLLDAPEVYLPFSDRLDATVAVDASGHERHGVYHLLGSSALVAGSSFTPNDNDGYLRCANDGSWVEVDYVPAFGGQAITLEVWMLVTAEVISGNAYPVARKGAFGTEYGLLVATTGALAWTIKPAASAPISIFSADLSPLVGEWIYIVGCAGDGITQLWINNVMVASGTYSGALATTTSNLFVAKPDAGHFNTDAGFDAVAVYGRVLSPTSIAVHYGARLLISAPIPNFTNTIITTSPTPTLWYPLREAPSDPVMFDNIGIADGAYVGGGPTLGVPGPITTLRNPLQDPSLTAASFENAITKYGQVTNPSVNSGTALSVLCFYKPDAHRANSGLVEKTIGGVVNTQWGLFQQEAEIVWRIKPTTTAIVEVTFPVLPEDVGRYMMIVATFNGGTLALYRNDGVLMAAENYASPVATGAGNLFVGILGSLAGVHLFPAQGDLAHIAVWNGLALTPAQIRTYYTAATWYPGALYVDLAMTEPRQAQDVLKQLTPLSGMRLGFTSSGAITCAVDVAAPTTILMAAIDGPGASDGTLLDCRDRKRPPLEDAVRDLIVNYRLDLLSGAYLRQLVRPISTRLDAQGNRIGRDRIINLDSVREDTAADRFACYMAARLALDETVTVALGPEARALHEGMLVRLTDAAMDYADDVLVAQEVTQVIDEIEAVLREWDEDLLYTYRPAAFPVGAGHE